MEIRKKGQEEMVGFIVIIIIVGVIALVLLSIGMRKTPETKSSQEINDFVYSAFQYSVDCDTASNFQELIIACSRMERCNEKNSCEIVKELAKDMIEGSLRVGSDQQYKHYMFKINSGNETLVFLASGNQTTSSIGTSARIITSRENINVSLKLYY